jgi:prepilin-type N-terminal cleavage/methylation domain-containing protein
MKRRAGFTLLEALTALAIAAMALAAVFELQHQLVNGQRAYEQALRQVEDRRNAMTYVRDLNPDEAPEGEIALPPDRIVRWYSTPLTEQVLSTDFPTGDGEFFVTLYVVTVEIADAQNQVLDRFEVEKLGWTTDALAGTF